MSVAVFQDLTASEYIEKHEWFVAPKPLRHSDTRQYVTFHYLSFIANIAATLEMQTSSSEFRVLYPSLMRPNRLHFFCLLDSAWTDIWLPF